MIRGDRLKILREERGYTQKELANVLGYGISTIQRIEREESDPSSDILGHIASHFGVSADYLLGLTDSPCPNKPPDYTDIERAIIAARRRDDFREALRLIIKDD